MNVKEIRKTAIKGYLLLDSFKDFSKNHPHKGKLCQDMIITDLMVEAMDQCVQAHRLFEDILNKLEKGGTEP